MLFSDKRSRTRWLLILASFFIVVLIVWNTYNFFQIVKIEERNKVELWASAQKSLANANEYTDLDLPLQIISTNTSIPIILTNRNDSIIGHNNIDEKTAQNPQQLQLVLKQLKSENKPIRMNISETDFRNLYYGNSPLLNKLKYYPIALLLIIILFATVVYNFYSATKMSLQNKLWAGMAKETAHQIGTPLSSLLGWIEFLKSENSNSEAVIEIEKDITRLQTITDRFSKIGSKPVLEKLDIISETKIAFDYLKVRSSKQVEFTFEAPKMPIFTQINAALHSWTIENLVKNAIDAMKGKGKLTIEIIQIEDTVKIKVIDTGKGIAKNQFKKIFEPGYTTKKRGWGLGLSLTKRIVEDYHNGRIKVLQSEIGCGTTIQISLKQSK
ncbi:PAS domain-containing sensor histidine kinase [Flavobacterium sp.]|uniref:sensor histidine kinase n=1 Tax=Flavobacterium sp. TaxID=239 RepID=UPI003529CC5C